MPTKSLEVRIQLIPKETTTLADGSDTVTTIDSDIDKTLGTTIDFSFTGTFQTTASGPSYHYGTATITNTSYVSLYTILGLTSYASVSTLYIKLLSISTGRTVWVKLDSSDAGTIALDTANDALFLEKIAFNDPVALLTGGAGTATIEYYLVGNS